VSLRVALAVALTVAVFAVALPGVDEAARQRTTHELRGEVGTVVTAGESLLNRDERTARRATGARRTVSVSLPSRSLAAAGVDYLAFGGVPTGDESPPTVRPRQVSYRLRDGPRRRFRVPIPLSPAGDRPLVVRGDGIHRLVLSLGVADGERVVVVERG
jgi:hypothetical protein